jgi:hypothetical protein
MNVRKYLKTSGLNSEREYFVKKWEHHFKTSESHTNKHTHTHTHIYIYIYMYIYMLILAILRKGWVSGKYFSLKMGCADEVV